MNKTKEFITKAKQIHGDKYDYSKIKYLNVRTKVILICPKHGLFEQLPRNHLKGQNCPKCAQNKQRKTKKQFILDARTVHGSKYDYSKVMYVTCGRKVRILCPKHGEFEQSPNRHLSSCGCPQCGIELTGAPRKTKKQFILDARTVHGSKYDYSKSIYKTKDVKVIIICPEHGEFEQRPSHHIRGNGCPHCSQDKQRKSRSQFIQESRSIHGSKYSYSKMDYIGAHSKITIICPEHGEFEQQPNDHLDGHGCVKCNIPKRTSEKQREVARYVRSLGIKVQLEKYIGSFCYDIVTEDQRIVIEYNGLYWHSSNRQPSEYHRTKRIQAIKNGYRVIQIWGDEWALKRRKIKRYLKAIFLNDSILIGARKTLVQDITPDQAMQFQLKHHVQGICRSPGGKHIGLFLDEQLIAEVSLYARKDHLELRRYTVDQGYKIAGGFEKLIAAIRKSDTRPIVTFCDMDKFDGQIYERAGFEYQGTTLQLKWTDNVVRYDRRRFMKSKLREVFGKVDLSKTEKEICAEHGIYQVWNSGIRKYVLK